MSKYILVITSFSVGTVKTRSDIATLRDGTDGFCGEKGSLEGQWCEKGPNCRDKHFQFRLFGSVGVLMGDYNVRLP